MSREFKSPPPKALALFRWYCRPDRLEELEGDLEEMYFQRLSRGDAQWKANAFFWWNVLRCFKKYSRSKSKKTTTTNMFSLFKSYFKLALRHSWKNKGAVSINVIGLGLSLSICVFVYMMHAYNLEFDNFYKNTEDVYRLNSITERKGVERRNEFSPMALDYELRHNIGSIEATSSFFTRGLKVKSGIDFFSERVGVVSADFPEMFELPLWYGTFKDFGKLPVVFLKKRVAERYFGSKVALGESLTIYLSENRKIEVTVGGVFEQIPENTSFNFDIILSTSDYFRATSLDPNDWSISRFTGHYLRLNKSQVSQTVAALNRSIKLQNETNKLTKIKRFELVPFATAQPDDLVAGGAYVNRRLKPEALIIFSTLALIVFITACFNLANTSIALIAKRLKEIGVRKTLGSGSRQILVQFLMEMSFVCALAFIIAISTANITSSTILGLFGGRFQLQDVDLTGVIMFVIGFLAFTTLIAGLLPALYAWKFQPVAIMRKSVKLKGMNWVNRFLIVAQYSFSILVLVTGTTFWQNSEYLKELDLGYQSEGVINLPVANRYFEQLRQEVDKIPGVVTAGAANHLGDFGRYSKNVQFQLLSDTLSHAVRFHGVDERYLDVMEVELSSGRGFIAGSDQDKILVSQALVDEFFEGKDVLNEVVNVSGQRKTIVGVTVDIIDDVAENAELLPTIIALSDRNENEHLVVKVTGRDLYEVEAELKGIWSEFVDQPYTGVHQQDFALGEAGRESKNLQKIFLSMALLSGLLSIIGIFSLAKLNITKRIKEISIRKVLGASIRELLITVNRSFMSILLISVIVGGALGFVLSDVVLSMIYKYHTAPSVMISMLCGAFIAFFSIIIISSVVKRPIQSNLVQGLRDD